MAETLAAWDDLSAEERFVFAIEWHDITEDRLRRLEDLVVRGRLTPEQERRWRELRALVDAHRPAVQRLIGAELRSGAATS